MPREIQAAFLLVAFLCQMFTPPERNYQTAAHAVTPAREFFATGYDSHAGARIDEDPTGLLNEGMRYRDLDSGEFITRDPAGFVDGPNMYTYVRDNPWSHFDPDGLETDQQLQQDEAREQAALNKAKENHASPKSIAKLQSQLDNTKARIGALENSAKALKEGAALLRQDAELTGDQGDIQKKAYQALANKLESKANSLDDDPKKDAKLISALNPVGAAIGISKNPVVQGVAAIASFLPAVRGLKLEGLLAKIFSNSKISTISDVSAADIRAVFSGHTTEELEAAAEAKSVPSDVAAKLRADGYQPITELSGGTTYQKSADYPGWVKQTGSGKNAFGGGD